MLYDKTHKALIDVVGVGCEPNFDALDHALGRFDGEKVCKVVCINTGGPADVEGHEEALRERGLEVRVVDQAGDEQVVMEAVPQTPTLLPVLRAHTWPHARGLPTEALLDHLSDSPLISYAFDMPTCRRPLDYSGLAGTTLEQVREQALKNLATMPVTTTPVGDNALAVLGEYAAETVLLPAFMRELQTRVGSSMMVVCIKTTAAGASMSRMGRSAWWATGCCARATTASSR